MRGLAFAAALTVLSLAGAARADCKFWRLKPRVT